MKYQNYKVYKKALERLVDDTHLTYRERRDDASLIYELIDRMKGVKPNFIFDYDDFVSCGECGAMLLRNYKCCPICEKRIDWSDWEVNKDGE